ncbi:hypothetical protein [Arthrobacter sp. ov118]|uniref:hypothetical protein n=1 Tax=Arthrobacter sp. ov118 TaxID=1761747 RepID=UPI0008E0E60C|nr:hypothetical protein [Arthrobacter sp. ov118]SFU10470.1 hypothetical protein SAMN04487915_11114 [Arthrobacter sp. ov118]
MAENAVVRTCDDLVPEDRVEARADGQLLHCGAVTETAPHLGMFWMMDTVTTSRKLLILSEFEIVWVSRTAEELTGARVDTQA